MINFVGEMMRKVVISVLVVLVAVVTGCGGAHRYDSRLTQVDSLMKAAPDSALTLVEALTVDELKTDHDRAYRDLLLTQTRYKCYIPATSDSDINRALDYYRNHPADREKLTRAYIYKGAVMQELNHPDSAMLYYKKAEAVADSTDYANLGFANLRIAQLYQYYFVSDTTVITRIKKAQSYFMATNDTSRMITTAGVLGSYPGILGQDSTRFYLRQAIDLSNKSHSHKGLQYQSKLAGSYFYDGDYRHAKDLAMDIYWNGREQCNERQFYHYAARSYIHLNQIDSARWLIGQIPPPINSVDSMNHYLTLAELAQATRNYDDYVRYDRKVKAIDTRIMDQSRNSPLTATELKWDADQLKGEIKSKANYSTVKIVCIVLLVMSILTVLSIRISKKRINDYRKSLDDAKRELEILISDLEDNKRNFESERNRLLKQIAEKNQNLSQVNKKYQKLEKKHEDVHERASAIVREKNAALNELYDYVRLTIQDVPKVDNKKSISLSRLFKNYHENKAIRLCTPRESFWDKLKSSVDLEYNGIATFVEKNYPQLSTKEFHFFCLLCANVSPHIIMLCMNYGSSVTVSKYKSKFVSKRMGVDVGFEDFIRMYLQGDFDHK